MFFQKKEGQISTLKETRFLALKKVIFHGVDWFYVIRPNVPGTVTIMPVLNKRKVLCVEHKFCSDFCGVRRWKWFWFVLVCDGCV